MNLYRLIIKHTHIQKLNTIMSVFHNDYDTFLFKSGFKLRLKLRISHCLIYLLVCEVI